eukprot:112157-Rhodomonas_salina.1
MHSGRMMTVMLMMMMMVVVVVVVVRMRMRMSGFVCVRVCRSVWCVPRHRCVSVRVRAEAGPAQEKHSAPPSELTPGRVRRGQVGGGVREGAAQSGSHTARSSAYAVQTVLGLCAFAFDPAAGWGCLAVAAAAGAAQVWRRRVEVGRGEW